MRLALSWAVVIVFQIGGHAWLANPISTPVAIVCFVVLFFTILVACFGVVREADHLAHKLGEPYGTLILTLSIVAIEVILIVAVMVGPGQSETIGRDSISAVMMIIINLVTGVCLLLGGLRYGEQEYNSQGAAAYLSMTVLIDRHRSRPPECRQFRERAVRARAGHCAHRADSDPLRGVSGNADERLSTLFRPAWDR